MCSIVGSFDREQLKMLIELNKNRGSLSSSFSLFDERGLVSVTRQSGHLENIPYFDGYAVCHQQAPTSAKLGEHIHPSDVDGVLLWHNGIIKENFLKKNNSFGEWDTHWLNRRLSSQGWSGLEDVEGSFACLYYKDNKLYAFRNQNAPLWVCGSSISSVRFAESIEMDSNVIYSLDFRHRVWEKEMTFENVEMPFFFAG